MTWDVLYDEWLEAQRAELQRQADTLPRRRWRMSYRPRGGAFTHRVPVDCWNFRYRRDPSICMDVPHIAGEHTIEHGTIIDPGVIPARGSSWMDMRCECGIDADVEVTDEFIAWCKSLPEWRGWHNVTWTVQA